MSSRWIVIALVLASGCGKKKKSEPAAEPTPAVQPTPAPPVEPPPPPVAAVPVDAAAPKVIDAPPQWGGPGSCSVKVSGAATLEQPDARGVVDSVTVNCSGTRVQLTIQPADAGALAPNKHFVIGKDRVTVSAAIDGTMLEGIEGTLDIKNFAPPDARGTFVLTARLPAGAVKLDGVLDTCPACTR